MNEYVIRYKNISLRDLNQLGVSDTLLVEVFTRTDLQGIKIADGFAISPKSFWQFIEYNGLEDVRGKLMRELDSEDPESIRRFSQKLSKFIMEASMPTNIYDSIITAYRDLHPDSDCNFVVRNNLLVSHSLNGWQKKGSNSIWNTGGEKNLIKSIQECFAPLYLDSILKKEQICSLNEFLVGVQLLNTSEYTGHGFAYTADPESGFPDVVHISGDWEIGQEILYEQDETIVYKPNFVNGYKSIIQKRMGNKSLMMSFDDAGNGKMISTPLDLRQKFVLNDEEILTIANWGIILEDYFNNQISLEWVRDGRTDELCILQVRPGQVKLNKEQL